MAVVFELALSLLSCRFSGSSFELLYHVRCRGIADENQIIEHVGNLRIIEYLRSCSDFSEFQIAEPLQAGGVLFAHLFQVQNKQRFVQLSEHVFECAGMRFGKFKGL